MSSNVEVIFEPRSENYDPNDDRWLEQVNELVLDCQNEAGIVRKEIAESEGTKGGIEELIVVLGSSGIISGVVEIFKSWIAVDRTRSLALKIKDGDKVIEYEVSGKGLNKDKINDFMIKALEIHSKKT